MVQPRLSLQERGYTSRVSPTLKLISTIPGTGAERGAFCSRNLSCAVRPAQQTWRSTVGNLLHYALVFLVVALVAAAVGFGGVAGFAMDAARLLFWVFIVLFVISLLAGLVRRA